LSTEKIRRYVRTRYFAIIFLPKSFTSFSTKVSSSPSSSSPPSSVLTIAFFGVSDPEVEGSAISLSVRASFLEVTSRSDAVVGNI
jgi:hypothetical protein